MKKIVIGLLIFLCTAFFSSITFAQEKEGNAKTENFNTMKKQSEHVKKNYRNYVLNSYFFPVVSHAYAKMMEGIRDSGMSPFYMRSLDSLAEYEIKVIPSVQEGRLSFLATINYFGFNQSYVFSGEDKPELYDAQISLNLENGQKLMTVNLRKQKIVEGGIIIASSFIFLEFVPIDSLELFTSPFKMSFVEENQSYRVSGEGIDVGTDGVLDSLYIVINDKTGYKITKVFFVDMDGDNEWDEVIIKTCYGDDGCITEELKPS